MIIREMKNHEICFVRKQRLSSYQEYRELVGKEHWESLERTLSSDGDRASGAEIYVAEADNEILGSVVLFPPKTDTYEWLTDTSEYPEIRMLAVDPGARVKGIGKSLLEHCINIARREGYSHIGLHTAGFMKNAISLYEKMGFERVPEQDFEPANDGIVVKGFKLNIL